MAGWLAGGGGGSQFGVVLQDDLQLLTQHDVPSDLQLAGEESLQTTFTIDTLLQRVEKRKKKSNSRETTVHHVQKGGEEVEPSP